MNGLSIEQSRFAKHWKLKRFLVSVLIFFTLIFFSMAVIFFMRSQLTVSPEKGISRDNAIQYWNNGKYDELLIGSRTELEKNPQDSFFLLMRGFASFYKSTTLTNNEERLSMIDDSIVMIRKALIRENIPLQSEAHYILGKAYFKKGRYYLDLSIHHLEMARELGIYKKDIPEYLALAWYQLDRFDRSIEYFDVAIKNDPRDLLLLSAAQSNMKAGNTVRGEALVFDVISLTKDVEVEVKARFLLCESFLEHGKFDEAEKQAQVVLERNGSSADAYYQLGLVYFAKGDPIKARAEWRKAVRINPSHVLARQRLNQ